MQNESLTKNFEDHLHSEEYCAHTWYKLKPLIPFKFVLPIIVVVDEEHERVYKNQENYSVLEKRRACEINQLNAHAVLKMQAVKRSVIVDSYFLLLWLFLSVFATASDENIGLIQVENSINFFRHQIFLLLFFGFFSFHTKLFDKGCNRHSFFFFWCHDLRTWLTSYRKIGLEYLLV